MFSCVLESVIGSYVQSVDWGMKFIVIKMYGPYNEKTQFWEDLISKSIFNSEALIIGGDLNFSMRFEEVWGPRERSDPLEGFF